MKFNAFGKKKIITAYSSKNKSNIKMHTYLLISYLLRYLKNHK